MRRLAEYCARIARSGRFQGFILAVIVANAVVLGLLTYETVDREIGSLLEALDRVFLAIYGVEMAIRITAYGRRPGDFFRSGWNVFDFAVVAAAILPGLSGSVTVLRIVRLLRVVRLLSVLPDMRVLVRGMARSLMPIGTMAVLGLLLMYVYGMIGWILFAEEIPGRWGTIGDAMLNLFVVMTLEEFPTLMREAMDVYPAAWIFFVSYVLLASFLVINVLIAIIINSVEEARRDERLEAVLLGHRDGLGEELDEAHATLGARERAAMRVHALRESLDELEAELGAAEPASQTASKARLRP